MNMPRPFDDGRDFHEVEAIAQAAAARLHPADYLAAVVAARVLRADMLAAIQSGELAAHRAGAVPAPPSWRPSPNERVVWVRDADAEVWLRARGLGFGGETAPAAQAAGTLRDFARAGAHARHAPTRDAKRLVLDWWADRKGTMTKEAAADAIVNERLVLESRATVRDWLKGA